MKEQGGQQTQVTISKEHYDSMMGEISQLKETVAYLTKKLFAPKSERFTDRQTGQLSLFDQQQQIQVKEQTPTETVSYTRKKRNKRDTHGSLYPGIFPAVQKP